MWAGGKNKMIKHLIDIFPTNVNSYCEPFFGGGAVFIYVVEKYNPEKLIINDKNESIIAIYDSIKNDYNEFIKRLNELERKYLILCHDDRKKYYYEIRNNHAWKYEQWSKPYESATLYFLMKTGFNGIFQINKNTNNRYGTPAGLLNQKDSIYDRNVIKWWHNVLQKTEILCGDWKDAVKKCNKNTFFFLDPPYRESFADYGNGFNDKQLESLITFANKQENVILTNRDDSNWFLEKKLDLNHKHVNITYTAGRRKKTDDGFKAKKAKEIILYRTNNKKGVLPINCGREVRLISLVS